MVRLGVLSAMMLLYLYAFQFQYGSIGSLQKLVVWIRETLFQFQYGSIGSMAAAMGEDNKRGFNSSMVRLGVKLAYFYKHIAVVSIPVWFDWENNREVKAPFSRVSFNSSMVRLGVASNSIVSHASRRFNSSMVRLGVNITPAIAKPMLCFNSSMVRLGVMLCRSSLSTLTRFNSSMVRLGDRDVWQILRVERVSIPVWFDWEWKRCF